jgi:glycosyltransferase involved in cell wall biosynthesis
MTGRWVIIHSGSAMNPWASSGIPHGLASGLREQGVQVCRVSCDLPWSLSRYGAFLFRKLPRYSVTGVDARPLVMARDARLRHIREVAAADVVVSMGSSFGHNLGPRVSSQFRVLYEDMTVAQSPHPPSPAKDRWIEGQRRLYQITDLCCAATPWVADSIERDYGVPRSKIEVVGFGANVVCEFRAKDWSTPRFLWVGVDWERKGGDLLLEAFIRADIPGARLDLVGRHPDVSIPGVRGHGVVREENRLREFFETATVFVLPSRFEAAGIVFLEAASAGTPCIGTRTGGLPHVLGPSGYVVAPNDIDALTSALRAMADPSTAERFVEPALEHARQYTWAAVAGRMADALRRRL